MDYREEILNRLVVIAQNLNTFTLVGRNKLSPADTQLPACIILDGDEEADEEDSGRRPANAPRRMRMRPGLQLVLAGTPEQIGTNFSTYRKLLINAIPTDPTLLGLTIDLRSVRYLGLIAPYALGRQVIGTPGLHFEVSYPLYPGTL